MLPQADIWQYGGKAAILNHVGAKLLEMPIPKYVVKGATDNLDSIMADFRAMRKPVIVRSSSPHEYGDFEGIFDSVPDVYDERGLGRAVRKVEESARSDRALDYAKQNGFDISDQMHVIIQEQSESRYTGAMMRHPNNPDWIFISYFLPGRFRDHNFLIYDEIRQKKVVCDQIHNTGISLEQGRILVEQYKKVESLADIAEGHSLFVEFGFEPFMLYQVRPFKKIATGDFDVPRLSLNSYDKTGLWTDLAFGITLPEGIVLPVLRGIGTDDAKGLIRQFREMRIKFPGKFDNQLKRALTNLGIMGMNQYEEKEHMAEILRQHNFFTDEKIDSRYCFITTAADREGYDVDLSVPKMDSLVLSHGDYFLVHGLMRLFKKANVVTVHPPLDSTEFFNDLRSVEDKVRIISNGKEAVVLKE